MAVDHNITAEEVRGWSRGRRPWSDDMCGEIATGLNNMRWAQAEPHTPRPAKKRLPTTAAHAQALLDELGTYNGDRVKEARDAIERALLEIEFPFGYGQALVQLGHTVQGMPPCEAEARLRKLELPPDTIQMLVLNTPEQLDLKLLQMARNGRRRWLKRPPRPHWHIPAFVIARMIGEVLMRRGLPVSKSRNSIFVRVACKAMRRMGHLDIKATAIARCLERDSVLIQDGLRLRLNSFSNSKGKV